ncbi:MAG: DegT/DnrJ/EryC1/StrS family aminotransferase [candidate division KSB1 bacterium]|nr:DegT/DnrJ/EryC1/StrS family aminotransferase [candidate division KSB1 bacterium]MDZ7393841.1 DegT/DnrJ/EryC1/StrS family aminotransferase [candidate division KSB1 bacterium]
MGSMAARVRQEWATFNGSAFCVSLTNGTHALQLALEAPEVGVGDEVFVPGLTWQPTAEALHRHGAVRTFGKILATPRVLTEPIAKVYEHRAELLAAEKGREHGD